MPTDQPSLTRDEFVKHLGDRYFLRHHISGVNSDVYLCVEVFTWAHVAVKVSKPHSHDPMGGERWQTFRDEVSNWAELHEHPNVTRCRSAGASGMHWFMVLEWVGAPEIRTDLLTHLSALDGMDSDTRLEKVVRLGQGICDGLAHIHASGIVHGDLKPTNVLIDGIGHPKITDLGTASRWMRPGRAKHPQAMRPVGTPEYMAPELWKGSPQSPLTDIYALGCVLYELATGHRLFDASDRSNSVDWRRLGKGGPLAAIPKPLRLLIADCLGKRASRRPASAAEVRTRLTRLLPPATGDWPAPAATDEEDDKEEGLEAGHRARRRVSLLSAAGRTADAIAQMDTAITDAMRGGLVGSSKEVSDEPGSTMATSFNDRGILVGATSDWLPSTADFITATRLDPRLAVAYANLAINYERMNQSTLAIVAFERAIELDPDDHRLYLRRARFLSRRGWHSAAHHDFTRAVTMAPDDPDACYGMADSLGALGRHAEAHPYRAKGLHPGHLADADAGYLRPGKPSRDAVFLAAMMAADFKENDGDHDAAIAAYSQVLEAAPWKIDVHLSRGAARLAAGDAVGAVQDLDAFLCEARTTHPLSRKALGVLRRAKVAASDAAKDDNVSIADDLPRLQPHTYIAHRTHGRFATTNLLNWLPLSAAQRYTLVDMLYCGQPSQKLKADRLVWNAFHEDLERRRARCGELATDRPDDPRGTRFEPAALSRISAELAIKNGFGIPSLFTEVRVSPNPVEDVRFSQSEAPKLGWASTGALGVWDVVPCAEIDHVLIENAVQAPVFAADGSSYLLLAAHDLTVRRAGAPTVTWSRSDLAYVTGCFEGEHGVAIGLSNGAVAFFDDLDEPRIRDAALTPEGTSDLRVWQSGDDEVAVSSPGALHRAVGTWDGDSLQVHMRGVPVPENAVKLLSACGWWTLWLMHRDELVLSHLQHPERRMTLAARDSTQGGLVAAAVSLDGTVVAAVCGSFLHVWRADEGATEYRYLSMTAQPWGRCVAVSADGGHIAVGTAVGSLAIYVMG